MSLTGRIRDAKSDVNIDVALNGDRVGSTSTTYDLLVETGSILVIGEPRSASRTDGSNSDAK